MREIEIEHCGDVHPEMLVSTGWVAEHPADPSVRVAEANEDQLLYPSGHTRGPCRLIGPWT